MDAGTAFRTRGQGVRSNKSVTCAPRMWWGAQEVLLACWVPRVQWGSWVPSWGS